MKFLSAGALQSLQLFNAPICRHTCTPWQLYPHHLAHTHTHTHTHSPAHPYTHSCHSYTRTPQQLYRHHLCTPLHLRISTNINSCIHNTYLQISANIHTCIHLQISANIHSYTTVPINCTNAQIVVVNLTVQKSSKSVVCQLQYTHFFFIPELKEYKLYKCWGHPATRTKDLKSKLGCVTN